MEPDLMATLCVCPDCLGLGYPEGAPDLMCARCDGLGAVDCEELTDEEPMVTMLEGGMMGAHVVCTIVQAPDEEVALYGPDGAFLVSAEWPSELQRGEYRAWGCTAVTDRQVDPGAELWTEGVTVPDWPATLDESWLVPLP